jgi:hypothetical protein
MLLGGKAIAKMAKTCIFCGRKPQSKTKEHVIPRWLIEMTGDPKRQVSFGTYNLDNKPPTVLAFDQFTFPACGQCNRDFSDLEGRARRVTERLLLRDGLTATDFNCLLDWLDKIRIGMWLGYCGSKETREESFPDFTSARDCNFMTER